MKFRMYVDEVGNNDLESSDDPLHRFLSLTGVILELDYVNTNIFPQMEKLKSKFFGSHPDEPIILHRKEVVNAKYPFESLSLFLHIGDMIHLTGLKSLFSITGYGYSILLSRLP